MWEIRKAYYFQFESQGLRIRSSEVEGQEKIDVPAQEGRENLLFFCLLVPFRPSKDRMLSIHFWWVSFLSLLNQMLISSRNTITDIPQNNVLLGIWAFLSPAKLTHEADDHRGSWDIPTEIHLWYSFDSLTDGVNGFTCQTGLRWNQGLRRLGSYSSRTAGICVLKILSL